MRSTMDVIAARVRGVAAENRFTQQRIADILDIGRGAVNARLNGAVPFTAAEVWELSRASGTPLDRFFPSRTDGAA